MIWNHYCDWYVELCKPLLNNPDSNPAQLRGTRHTLVGVMETMLRLAHPIMPFITEEIWQTIAPLAGRRGATIMTQPYPQPQPDQIDESAEREMRRVIEVVLAIRKLRGENNTPPGKRVPVFIVGTSALSNDIAGHVEALAKTKAITTLKLGEPTPDGAMAVVGEMQIVLPVENPDDIEGEINRTNKELRALEKRITQSAEKLSNQNFIKKAPDSVVTKEKAAIE